ncbi:MAG TPA: siderophore-interacting protein [Polyangiaceae bacterium]
MATTEAARSPRGIEGAITRWFMKRATVRECNVLGEQFRLVTLSGDALRGVKWLPGQKLQVALGSWAYRTFTPLSWDAEQGSTQLLLFLHGEAPASAWGRALQVGNSCTLFGPRDSLDLSALDRPALVFGDETSFGLAHSMRFTPKGAAGVRMLFEVTSKQTARGILDQLGVADVDLVERRPDDAHLNEVEQLAVDQLQTRSIQSWVLSGKASSIQRVSKRLRSLGVARGRIRTRAYWAPGKVGLD